MRTKTRAMQIALAVALAVPGMADAAGTPSKDKIPITTASEEARQLYLKGRDLAEKLRATDARSLYARAAAKDKTFALAHLGLANTAGTAKEFFDALGQAVALSANASEPERLLISGVDAGAKGDERRYGFLRGDKRVVQMFQDTIRREFLRQNHVRAAGGAGARAAEGADG